MFNKPCKVCLEKDKRIEEMQKFINFMQKLCVNTPVEATYTLEAAERALDSEEVTITKPFVKADAEKEAYEAALVQSEASRILAGNY